MKIPRIPEDADFERNTSKLLCAPLSALIIIQACNQLPQDDAITNVKSQVRSLRVERASTSSLSVDIQLSQEQLRTIYDF
jgi:SUMO ligase MMS21 Smc5/6 complex component